MAAEGWDAHHRFVVSSHLRVGETCNLDSLARQLATVLRLAVSSAIILVNGDGHEYQAILQTLTPRHASAAIINMRPVRADPHVRLTLYQCTLKHDKFEWVLQKGVELGVSTFVPVVSRRSVVRPATALLGKLTRWTAILTEATEQCGRTQTPTLAKPVDLSTLRLPSGAYGFVAWEEAGAAPALGDAVTGVISSRQNVMELALVIGPEGGLTSEEVDELRRTGWQVVTLGPRTLRAETAAITGVAVIMERCGELGSMRA